MRTTRLPVETIAHADSGWLLEHDLIPGRCDYYGSRSCVVVGFTGTKLVVDARFKTGAPRRRVRVDVEYFHPTQAGVAILHRLFRGPAPSESFDAWVQQINGPTGSSYRPTIFIPNALMLHYARALDARLTRGIHGVITNPALAKRNGNRTIGKQENTTPKGQTA